MPLVICPSPRHVVGDLLWWLGRKQGCSYDSRCGLRVHMHMLALTCWLSCQHKTVKPGRSSKRNCLFELGSTLQPEQKPARLWLRNQTGFAFVWNLSQHLPVDSNSFSKPSSKCCQLCVVAEFANFVLAQASLKKFGAKRITVSSLSSGVWWSAHCIPVSSGPDTIPGNRQAMHGQEKIAT